MYETIDLSVDGPVATLLLNRPDVRNAFNARMIADVTDACAEIRSRDDIRVVVVRGSGKTFSAGADINWMRASLDFTRQENIEDAQRMSDMFSALNDVPQVTISAVHGAALGGGMGIVAACDVVIAESDAVFGFTEVNLGIAPAVISRVVLPKIGAGWARALYLTGERFDAEVARRIGLVHWIVPPGDLDAAVESRLAFVGSSGPAATREAKALIGTLLEHDRSDWRMLTTQCIAELRASAEGQEGLRAFLERRKPGWAVDD